MSWLEATDDPILHGSVANPEPELTKGEYWQFESGRWQMARDGEWGALLP